MNLYAKTMNHVNLVLNKPFLEILRLSNFKGGFLFVQ